jgi:hypothetical protein
MTVAKRFFRADDNGVDYWFVAANMEHAKRLIIEAGVDLDDLDEPAEWSELTEEAAKAIRCNTSDDNRGRGTIPLAECDLGEWFCSEW